MRMDLFISQEKKVLIVYIMLITVFCSCYSVEKTQGLAYLSSYRSDSLEIELPYIVKGRSSLHNLTFEKFKYTSADWIYFSMVKGIITSDSLVLVYVKGHPPQSDLKGEISIKDSTLTVNFRIPRYNNKDIVKRWVKYKFNGTYKLIRQ